MNRKITCFASVISEIQQSDIYLTVKARLLETPRANLNGVRVTAAFVDEIVNNEANYVGLPLCADVKNLADGDYQHLGHLYDARTGEFHSAQIGSFYHFEKEDTADGAALIGYARIMKRNKAVCKAISELFAEGSLKFSFEISCGSYRELDDGTIEIDASKNNYLEGAAVVSFPACENAVALDLVAECNLLADDTRKGDNMMTDENKETIVSEEQNVEENASVEEVAETAQVEETAKCKDDDKECAESTEDEEPEQEEEDEKEEETASVEETTSVEESTSKETASAEESVAENAAAQNIDNSETAVAEEVKQEIAEGDKPAEDVVAEETTTPDYMSMIAELKKTIESLSEEITKLKSEYIVAETIVAPSVAQTANPFIAEMKTEKKYGLLEPEEKVQTYTLL